VLDDGQVRSVTAEILTAAAPGTVVAVHSTIRAETAEELAAVAAPCGVVVVDAPVSGGFMGAHEGTLAVMVGGTAEAVERCREPFSRWATLVEHLGPVGAGTRAKLARNLITFVSYAAATEAQRLAEAAGVDLGRLAEVVRHSDVVTGGPGAIMFRNTTAPLERDDSLYEIVEHTLGLGEKDLALALELGRQLDVDLPLAALALERLRPGLGL
jgi:2-hydroxy-3-oxopropionate reductase